MRNYSTIQGDTWDYISKKNYGSEKHIDILLAANPDHRMTFIFSAGIVLSVPDLPQAAVNLANLPPWKRT